jgi:SAM-dependent methyltransferase
MTNGFSRARALLGERRNGEALEALESAPVRTAEWHALRGQCLARLGRFAEAAVACDNATASGADSPENLDRHAGILMRAGRAGDAARIALLGLERTGLRHFLSVLAHAALLAPEDEGVILDQLGNLIVPAPAEAGEGGSRINVPATLEYYDGLAHFRPLLRSLAETNPAAFHIAEFDSFVSGRAFEGMRVARRAFEALREGCPNVPATVVAAYVASRFESALFAAPDCALDVLPSAVMSLGQRPYVLLHESVESLFHPFTPSGGESPYLGLVRHSLEADECLAIVTQDATAADRLGAFFASDRIRAKCVVLGVGAATKDALACLFRPVLEAVLARAVRLNGLKGRPFRALPRARRAAAQASGFDGLVLTNQNLSVVALTGVLAETRLAAPLVVTTHEFFPEELDALIASAPHVAAAVMADWYDDGVLSRIDQEATAALADGTSPYLAEGYAVAFNKENLRRRALFLWDRVRPLLAPDARILFVPDLGNPEDVWRELGGDRIECPVAVAPVGHGGSPECAVVSKDGAHHLFLTSLRRVELADGVEVRRSPLSSDVERRCQGSREDARDAFQALARGHLPDGAPAGITTTVHEFRHWMARLGAPVSIVIDGYHPPNYSRSYIDYFAKDAAILAREPVSLAWFSRYGWRTVLEPAILKPLRFAAPALPDGERLRVLVALNHAGDWSALIHRSDTDRLVKAMGDLAAALPGIDVRVRAHPTMATPEHEGVLSRERLANHLLGRKLPNLTVSTGSLAEDLAWSTVVLSEYSQVLIDGWSCGKPGVIVNLTGRRSYFQVYEDLGFPAVSDLSALVMLMRDLARDPAGFLSRQAAAAERANAAFDAAAGKGVRCPACGADGVADGIGHLDFPPARVKHCRACGHAFAAPEPAPSQLTRYYDQRTDIAWSAALGGPLAEAMRQRGEEQARFIEELVVPRGGEDAPLLDLGCGMGLLCKAWSERGRSALGIDTNRSVVLSGRAKFGADLRVCKMEDGIPVDPPWRVIALSHVLEHLPQPALRLRSIREALADGGWLFVEVPGIRSGYFESREDMEGHIHFFTEESLRIMLERCGFEVVKLCSVTLPIPVYMQDRKVKPEGYDPVRNDGPRSNNDLGVFVRCMARATIVNGDIND